MHWQRERAINRATSSVSNDVKGKFAHFPACTPKSERNYEIKRPNCENFMSIINERNEWDVILNFHVKIMCACVPCCRGGEHALGLENCRCFVNGVQCAVYCGCHAECAVHRSAIAHSLIQEMMAPMHSRIQAIHQRPGCRMPRNSPIHRKSIETRPKLRCSWPIWHDDRARHHANLIDRMHRHIVTAAITSRAPATVLSEEKMQGIPLFNRCRTGNICKCSLCVGVLAPGMLLINVDASMLVFCWMSDAYGGTRSTGAHTRTPILYNVYVLSIFKHGNQCKQLFSPGMRPECRRQSIKIKKCARHCRTG